MYQGTVLTRRHSSQGPYFGQQFWFYNFHSEDVPSAKKRYDEQILRVYEVLNGILEGKEYLVGGKLYVMPAP
jgi:glutathione S-transferase